MFEENSPNVVADKNKITLPDVHKDDEGIQQQFACSPLDNFGEVSCSNLLQCTCKCIVIQFALGLCNSEKLLS